MARTESNGRRAAWSKIVEEHGIQVRIFERTRGSVLYRSVIIDGRKERKRLKHRDRTRAETQAKALARSLAQMQLSDRAPSVRSRSRSSGTSICSSAATC